MAFFVKNTTFRSPVELLCPHSCRCCGEIGQSLCDCCKNNIILTHENYCLNCQRLIATRRCPYCDFPPTLMVGWRDEIIGKLVEEYKYGSVHDLGAKLAEVLDGVIPIITGRVAIVPLPTITGHIRERGFDHTLEIAKKLARRRGWQVEKLLVRAKDSVQVGAGQAARILQAAEAYDFVGEINPEVTYILLDDVWTTGASMRAALKKLQKAGAEKVALVVLAVSR